MDEFIRKSDVLIEALPYIQAFAGKAIVVKYGGSALANSQVVRGILQDLIFLSEVGIRSILVHGGGPEITRTLSVFGLKSDGGFVPSTAGGGGACCGGGCACH